MSPTKQGALWCVAPLTGTLDSPADAQAVELGDVVAWIAPVDGSAAPRVTNELERLTVIRIDDDGSVLAEHAYTGSWRLQAYGPASAFRVRLKADQAAAIAAKLASSPSRRRPARKVRS